MIHLFALAAATRIILPAACPALDLAAETLGGATVLQQLPAMTWAGAGREYRTAEVQGPAPGRMVAASHEERLSVDPARASAAYSLRTGRHDGTVRARTLRSGGEADTYRRYARRIPHFLVAEMLAARSRVRCLADTTAEGRTYRRLAFSPPGEHQALDVWIDPSAGHVERVGYLVDLPGIGDAEVVFRYSGWGAAPALVRAPTGHQTLVAGRMLLDVTYTSLDTGLVATREGRGISVTPAAAAPPAVTRTWDTIATGVHLVRLNAGLSSMIVELGDELVLLEAPAAHPSLVEVPSPDLPGSSALVDSLLRDIAARFPAKTIRAVAITHLHSDHLGGLRPLIVRGIPIIGPAGTEEFVTALSANPMRHHPDGLSLQPRLPRIQEVTDSIVLSGGGRQLVLYEVGANPHTDAMLFAHVPDVQIAFQGDLFYPAPDGPAIVVGREPVSAFFADWVRRHGVAITRVYGVHGGVGGPPHFEAARAGR